MWCGRAGRRLKQRTGRTEAVMTQSGSMATRLDLFGPAQSHSSCLMCPLSHKDKDLCFLQIYKQGNNKNFLSQHETCHVVSRSVMDIHSPQVHFSRTDYQTDALLIG